MKIYRLAQTTQTTGQPSPQEQNQKQEVQEAIQNLMAYTAALNKNLSIIQQQNIMPLFQKDTLINAIQSGNTAQLNPTTIDPVLKAMSEILRLTLMINDVMAIINTNQDVLKKMNMDISTIHSQMITTLNSGDFSQFTAMFPDISANAPAASQTSSYSGIG